MLKLKLFSLAVPKGNLRWSNIQNVVMCLTVSSLFFILELHPDPVKQLAIWRTAGCIRLHNYSCSVSITHACDRNTTGLSVAMYRIICVRAEASPSHQLMLCFRLQSPDVSPTKCWKCQAGLFWLCSGVEMFYSGTHCVIMVLWHVFL